MMIAIIFLYSKSHRYVAKWATATIICLCITILDTNKDYIFISTTSTESRCLYHVVNIAIFITKSNKNFFTKDAYSYEYEPVLLECNNRALSMQKYSHSTWV